MTKHFPLKKIKLINQFISPTYQRLSKDKVQGRFCTGFKRKMWPDKATVTSEQLTFLFGILQLISPHSWKHAGNKSVSCSGLSRGSHVMTWVVHVESKSHHLKANLWAHTIIFTSVCYLSKIFHWVYCFTSVCSAKWCPSKELPDVHMWAAVVSYLHQQVAALDCV